MTILLVDDDDDVRRATALLLECLGCTVIQAAGGEAALMFYHTKRAQIDCVVTDVIMPGMGGAELAGRLREIDPAVRIVFCTGDAREIEMTERVLGAGAAIIQKPYDGRVILQKIQSLLGPGRPETAL